MSQQIRMTPEQMRTRAAEVKSQHETFDGVITKMNGIISNLQGEWEGAASRAFYEQFDRLRPSFEQMKQLLFDLNAQLSQTAQAVETMDQDIASKFRG